MKKSLYRRFTNQFMKGFGNRKRWILNNIKVEGNKEQMDSRRKLHNRICNASRSDYKEGMVNDVGTTLYLIGALEEEKYLDPIKEEEKVLSYLMRAEKPTIGSVIITRDESEEISRMGLVTLIDPLRITSRRKEGGNLKVDMIPNLVGFRLAKKAHLIEYYTPKK